MFDPNLPPRPSTSEPLSGGLAGRIAVPREEWTAQEIVDQAREAGVRLVSLLHVGGDGLLKTLDFAPRSPSHLREIVEGGERADGSSLFGGADLPAGKSDVVLRPRPSTAFLDPFAERPTLALLCGHLDREGRPLPQSPDTILRAATARLTGATGLTLAALGEVEFFLGKPHDPATDAYGRDDRGYHATAPFVFGQRLRRRAMHLLTEMGVPVKYGHSEVGYVEAEREEAGPGTSRRDTDRRIVWEQHEIELALQPLPDAADAIVLTQWVLRLLARREGLLCNTAPMVAAGHAGNGLHVHLSPQRDGVAQEVSDGEAELRPDARALVGGLVLHGGALMAWGNAEPGSFERLSQGKEAPGAIRWGHFDRSALVRIPVTPRDRDGRPFAEPTVEFRLPDGSALVHLLLAGVAQAAVEAAGRDDLDAVLRATSVHQDGGTEGRAVGGAGRIDRARQLPRTPREVATALEASRAALQADGIFPDGTIEAALRRLRDPA